MKKISSWIATILSMIILLTVGFIFRSYDFDEAFFVEGILSIFVCPIFLEPLAGAIRPNDEGRLFVWLCVARVILLFIGNLINASTTEVIDGLSIFIGGGIIVPIALAIAQKKNSATLATNTSNLNFTQNTPNGNLTNTLTSVNQTSNAPQTLNSVILTCANCENVMKISDKFCTNCGKAFSGDNVIVTPNPDATIAPRQIVDASSFDPMYNLSEKALTEEFIKRELVKVGLTEQPKMLPREMIKRKKILGFIFAFLIFIYISLIFFHFPFLTYFIGLIILVIYGILMRRMKFIKYLVKQVKARPSEKISNIVMSTKEQLVPNNSYPLLITATLLAILLPLVIFYNPHTIYDNNDDGYVLRFYTFGLTNFTTVKVPEEYKGKPVIGLRGNAFSNMFFLKNVELPETMIQIRGGAFANDYNLKEINIPDSVTYIGGEAFRNCFSLKNIHIPSNIKEIRGNTFENCRSLEKVEIPDKVVRIGGHAFYGCSSLKEVKINPTSKLKEIGSSAFRSCDNLYSIYLPYETEYNYRAFKESPTNIHKYTPKGSTLIYTGDYDYSYDSNYGNNNNSNLNSNINSNVNSNISSNQNSNINSNDNINTGNNLDNNSNVSTSSNINDSNLSPLTNMIMTFRGNYE